MDRKTPSLWLSLTPIIFLILLLVINVIIYKDNASYGPNQIALLLGAFVTGVLGHFILGTKYQQMEDSIISNISKSLSAMTVLLVVGSLIGAWILSGTVPAMIYYGLKILNPTIFLPVACVTCAIVSLSTGSSWSTTGTIGIALIGIGKTMGIYEGAVAGAVISGAYFGDKMSPLSDTTNLAPAVAGTDIFSHIRHMAYSSGPAMILALIGFTILSFFYTGSKLDVAEVNKILGVLDSNFNINLWCLLPPALVLVMIRKKLPALPAITIGILIGFLVAIIFQGDMISRKLGAEYSIKGVYSLVTSVSFEGFSIDTGHKLVNKLLNRGGMSGMLNTVWLIFAAMIFGGTLEATGMLAAISDSILKMVRGTGSLIGATIATCIVLNATASDQFLAIVVPGKMFRSAYEKYKLHPKNLSRALEDAGTVTSVLIPWNSGGAYNASVLGVATLTYAPFCLFNILSPLVSVFLGAMNLTIEKKLGE